MVDSVKEQVSACLDGELPERELPLLSKRIGQDGELRAALTRYALISETLRTGDAVHASKEFAEGVMARIGAEAQSTVTRTLSPAAWQRLRPAAGIAVAASVAALAVFSVQQSGLIPEQATVDNLPIASAVAPAPGATDRYVVPSMTSNSTAFIPATRLTNYIVAHSEYSSPLGRRSVLSGVLAEGEADLVMTMSEDDAPAAPEEGAQR